MRIVSSCLLGLFLLACGGSQAEPESAANADDGDGETAGNEAVSDEAGEGEASEEEQVASGKLPTKCHKQGSVCLPPPSFVKKLCADYYPGAALHFFHAEAPWTRGYITRKTKAWNASGGVSDNEAMLEFDEEVVLLFKRDSDLGGMQVSGAMGGYDALRWDGTCVTLSSEEITLDKPPQPKHPKIEWRYLDDPIQEAMRESDDVTAAYRARRQECKGVVSGKVSDKCVKADAALSQAIVDYVSGGGKLAMPTKMP